MTDLKQCPFCGGEAKLELGNYTFDGEKYNDVDIYVRCETCNIMQYQGMFCNCQKDELESCCETWNTRAFDQDSYEAGRRDAQAEIDAACAECEAQQERELQEAQKERTCTATFILKGRPNYLLSLYSCGSCGVSWHIEPSREPNYCPNCGAKVIQEVE